jgi:hypothetical protein
MATTLPTLTKRMDDAFTETWVKTQSEATDNILDATPIMAALKAKGCLVPQAGGDVITRTIKYGKAATPVAIAKGDTLSQGEPELETVARWTFRYLSTHVQRDSITDNENRGAAKIKDYVTKRLTAARDALAEANEDALIAAYSATAETTDKVVQGLNEMVPIHTEACFTTGTEKTYGGVNRGTTITTITGTGVEGATVGNTWWSPRYKALNLPIEVNLVSDMKDAYNGLSNNREPPNLIISDLSMFSLYEDFALDASQIVKGAAGNQLVDLGFGVLKFKGVDWTWSPDFQIASKMQMLMLNTKFIELVYDPGLWGEMTEWKPIPLQLTRIAHIIQKCNLITTQPRRHLRLYEHA